MKTDHIHSYNSPDYKDFLDHYRKSGKQKQLIVFAGEFEEDRNYAIHDLKSETKGKVAEIDLNPVIELSEKKSYANIDKMVSEIDKDVALVIFRNAELLNGAYTGFTASAVKYATPQEKYFLKKIREIDAALLIELKSTELLDRRIINEADNIIIFSAPSSFLDKIFWKLKNIHVHGSQFYSPRKA